MTFKLNLMLFVAVCTVATPTQAASFNCLQVVTNVERIVCNDPVISKLDDELAKAYRDVMDAASAESKDQLIVDQRRWLTRVRNICVDEGCLKKAYDSRKVEMEKFFEEKFSLPGHEKEMRDLLNNSNPYVLVACDSSKQSIYVAEGRADDEGDIPKGPNARSLNEMLKFIPSGKDDGRTEVKTVIEKVCRAGAARYKLTIVPHKFNHHVQGACGAAAPSAKLTLLRNDKILLKDLIFRINCFQEGAVEMEIESIFISEAERRATFYIRNNEISKKLTLDFNSIPESRDDIFR